MHQLCRPLPLAGACPGNWKPSFSSRWLLRRAVTCPPAPGCALTLLYPERPPQGVVRDLTTSRSPLPPPLSLALSLARSAWRLVFATGMDFYVCLERRGYRVARRRKQKAHVGVKHKVTKEDAIKW